MWSNKHISQKKHWSFHYGTQTHSLDSWSYRDTTVPPPSNALPMSVAKNISKDIGKHLSSTKLDEKLLQKSGIINIWWVKQILHWVTKLAQCLIEALWLVKTSHLISFTQSDCFILGYHSYSVPKFVYVISSWCRKWPLLQLNHNHCIQILSYL